MFPIITAEVSQISSPVPERGDRFIVLGFRNDTWTTPPKWRGLHGRRSLQASQRRPPVKERYSDKLPNFGRVIMKSISVDYLERKGGTDGH